MREPWRVALSWFLIAAGMFVYCWCDAELDDFSGWIPVVVVLQGPAAWAIAQPVAGAAPLRATRSLALTVCSALVISSGVLFDVVQLSTWAWDPSLRGAGRMLFVFGLVSIGLALAFYVLPLRLHHRHRQAPHPQGARRTLWEATIVAAVTIAIATLTLPVDSSGAGVWLPVGVPLLWVAPLWLVLPRPAAAAAAPRAIARTSPRAR